LIFLAALFSVNAAAASDDRLSVFIPETGQPASRPDFSSLANSALPVIWDRLIPRSKRTGADALPATANLVSRIVPEQDKTLVEFNGPEVFSLLKANHIPRIKSLPRFNLRLKVQSNFGYSMQQSQQLLYQQAGEIAEKWGILLTTKAPALLISWRWLNEMNQVALMVRGNTRLREYSEVRQLELGDPVDVLGAWLQEVMLNARDAYAVDDTIDQPGLQAQPTNIAEKFLVFDRVMPLSEQVVMETGLRADPRVFALIPKRFSAQLQRYRLLLKGNDDAWLTAWFARRGIALQPIPGGWQGH